MLAQKKKVVTKKAKVAKSDDREDINVFSVDKKYCYTSFNKSHWQETKRIWNVEIKEGTNLLDIITIPEVKKTAKKNFDRALKGELFSDIQHLPDGAGSYEIFWTPVFKNDKIVGVTVFATHSARLNKMEVELRQSEERYRSILLASPDNITITDLKGRIIMGSPSGASMFGFDDANEIIGHFLYEYILPEDRERASANIAEMFAGATRGANEYKAIRKDGSIFDIEVNGKFIKGENGERYQIIFIVRDISERKRAASELLSSKEQYDKLVARIPIGVYIVRSKPNGEFNFEFVSPRMAEILNESADDILKDNTIAFNPFHPDEKEEFIKLNIKVIKSGNPFEWTGRLLIDGNIKWVHIASSPELQDNGDLFWHGVITDITKQKQVEKALQESEKDLKRAQKIAKIGSWEWSPLSDKIIYSDEIYNQFGVDKESSVENFNNLVDTYIHPDDKEILKKTGEIAARTGVGQTIEYRIIRPNGQQRWIRSIGESVFENGQLVKFFGTSQDITERRLAKQALEKSELMLKESQKVAHLGTYIWDLSNDSWKSSKILDDIFGIDENYVRSLEGWTNLIHPDFRTQMNEYVGNEVLIKHKPFNKEYKIIKQSNGEEYWVHGLGRLELNENNEPVKLYGTITDITNRKQTEKYQSLSNEILRILNSNLNLRDMIDIVLKTIKKETKLSAVAIRLKKEDDYPYFIQYGFSDDFVRTENSIIAKDCNGGIYRDKDGVPLLECTCGLVISGRTIQNHDLFTNAGSFFTNDSHAVLEIPHKADPRLHPRNKCIHVGYGSFAIIPILVNENILGTLQLNEKKKNALSKEMIQFFEGVCLNIGTALMRKQAEESLKNKMDELLVINKKLEQFAHANKELEQFAYLASHDLKEPLRTVENYIQLFEDDYEHQLDERGRKYLHTVIAATKRMSILIKTLLEFSQLGINKKLSLVDCKNVIEDVIIDLDSVIKSSGALIEVSEMPKINLYESEIRQVFQNLITNAIKFRKKDTKPIIRINSEKIEEGWKFSVSDNGIGIAPAYYNRVFEIFQRLHTNKEYEGSGIGLANCKKIIQLHLGEIWIESTEGEGSKFNFTIPKL